MVTDTVNSYVLKEVRGEYDKKVTDTVKDDDFLEVIVDDEIEGNDTIGKPEVETERDSSSEGKDSYFHTDVRSKVEVEMENTDVAEEALDKIEKAQDSSIGTATEDTGQISTVENGGTCNTTRKTQAKEALDVESAEGVESEESVVKPVPPPRAPRRSTRTKKPPDRFGNPVMHQMTKQPVDRKVQTLQTLTESGVLGDLDSEMAHKLIGAIMM